MLLKIIIGLIIGFLGGVSALSAQISVTFNYLPQSACDQIIHHSYFSLCYSEKHEQALWVAYPLTPAMVNGAATRSDKFKSDPKVTTGSASPADYKGSGYDRGHLAPAADMKISIEAMDESFYMSNMSPQVPAFNRGIWSQLEDQVRDWVGNNDTLFIVSGGILSDSLPEIGTNQVSVPELYYKIVLDLSPEPRIIAFLLPNQKGDKPLSSFLVSIDYLESISHIDFFPALPDSLENQLEMLIMTDKWSIN